MGKAFKLRSNILCQCVYLEAMLDYANKGGKSRGSALYNDENGSQLIDKLPLKLKFTLDEGQLAVMVQELGCSSGVCNCTWRAVRPIPKSDGIFENVWRKYRKHKNIW